MIRKFNPTEPCDFFELKDMSTKEKIKEIFEDIFNIQRNTSRLEGINVTYIDNSLFDHKDNRIFLLKDMERSFKENVVGFELEKFIYLTSLYGLKVSDIENSRFPNNLYDKLKDVKCKYIVSFFDLESLGNKKVCEFIKNTTPKTKCICINENREYTSLEIAYIRSLFSSIKKIMRKDKKQVEE